MNTNLLEDRKHLILSQFNGQEIVTAIGPSLRNLEHFVGRVNRCKLTGNGPPNNYILPDSFDITPLDTIAVVQKETQQLSDKTD